MPKVGKFLPCFIQFCVGGVDQQKAGATQDDGVLGWWRCCRDLGCGRADSAGQCVGWLRPKVPLLAALLVQLVLALGCPWVAASGACRPVVVCEEMGHATEVELVVAHWPLETRFWSLTCRVNRAQAHGAVRSGVALLDRVRTAEPFWGSGCWPGCWW